MPALKPKFAGALLLLSSLSACSERGAAASAGEGRGTRGQIVDSASGTAALGLGSKRAYRPVAVSSTGAVGGTIRLEGTPVARDSVVAVSRDARICGDSASVHEVRSNGGTLANVLVWVDGVASGKPLPDVRRQTLTIEQCRFEPRMIATVSRSTINVLSRDGTEHQSRFYREGTGEPIERIVTLDAGQVVPSEKIAGSAGIVEARCAQHPWARAYIAVFDHPYFAITDAQGAFNIEGLPPGTYTVKMWHELLTKPVEQQVVIQPGGAARLDLALNLGA